MKYFIAYSNTFFLSKLISKLYEGISSFTVTRESQKSRLFLMRITKHVSLRSTALKDVPMEVAMISALIGSQGLIQEQANGSSTTSLTKENKINIEHCALIIGPSGVC